MANSKGHKTWTKEKFISKAIEIHGNTFDYSLVTEFNNYKADKVIIKCNNCGSIFEVSPCLHLHNFNGGCKVCSKTNHFRINDISEVTCKYCGKIFPNPGALATHELQCKKNPNIKTYICQYCGKECKNLNSLHNHENQCKKNPNRVLRTKNQLYSVMTDTELINVFNTKYKNVKTISELRHLNRSLLNHLKERNILDIAFPNRKIDRSYKNNTDDEIINKINIYNKKGDVPNTLKTELKIRNLEWPEKFIHKKTIYRKLTNEELINIRNTKYKNLLYKDICKQDGAFIKLLIEREILDIVFPEKRKINSHSEYCNMDNDELLHVFFTKYKHIKNTYELYRIDKPLLHQIRKHNLLDILFPNRMRFMSKLNKLDLLTKYDLHSLDWAVILDLIGIDKLPKEFQVLAKYGENTPERKKMIQDLINSYNIEVPENDIDEETNDDSINNDNIETEVNDITNEDTNIYDNENKELNPLKETKTIGEILGEDFNETLFSTGDKFIHLFNKSMHQLWNRVLRDNENNNENTINEIHQKIKNNSLTKYEKYIYEEFLKEYDEVINLEIH